ncbi:AI-2E family transporter [Limibacter armeniacum]|uniref:AI-2E family transporter n=1 Tax=Limibacter armeniacum TaxID=466084 RepID=UPI002FE6BC79
MNERKFFFDRRVLNFTLWSIGLIVVGWYLRDILAYLLIALVLSAILRTPTNYFANIQFFGLRMPRGLSILISFLLLFGMIALFVYLFAPLVSEQIKVISNIDFTNLLRSIEVPLASFERFMIDNQLTVQSEGFLKDSIFSKISELPERIPTFINSLLQFTGNIFVGLIAVMFITFFFLYEPGNFKKYFISLIPNKYFEVSISAVSKTENLLSNYLLGLFVQMVSIFSIASLGLLIAGVEYAVTIAVFAAIANLIPFLGPLLGGVFGLFVGLSTNAGLLNPEDYLILTIKIVSVFAVVQLTDNLFLQPMIFSKSVKTHPLVIFLAVFVGAAIANILGMILAIPTFTIIRVILGEFYKGYKQYQIFRD